jgi:hypothetical protein
MVSIPRRSFPDRSNALEGVMEKKKRKKKEKKEKKKEKPEYHHRNRYE